MTIDIYALREDLKASGMGAYYGAGFGGGLIEAMSIDDMSDDEVVELALNSGIDLSQYQVD